MKVLPTLCGKNPLSLLILLLLTLSVLGTLNMNITSVSAVESPYIAVVPPTTTGLGIGENFTVSIYTDYIGKQITDTWVGNGSTTEFFTTEQPIVIDTEKVYVNEALMIKPDDYIINYVTGNITFTTAPPNGAEVKATYLYGDVWGWQFALSYDPTIIQGVNITNGDLIHPDKSIYAMFDPGEFDNEVGKLSLPLAYFFFQPPYIPPTTTSGPGTLANVTFQVVGYGTSDITLGPDTRLKAVDYNIIDAVLDPNQIGHGYFSNVHDVAVVSLVAPDEAVVGQLVPISVTVANKGGFSETFNVLVYANETTIATELNIILDAGAPTTLEFSWNTTGFALGEYTISANASTVPDEINTENNVKVYDQPVTIIAPPVANFTYSPPTPIVGEVVTFDASTSTPNGGAIVDYSWDFGDGNTGTGVTATYAYTTSGTYTVTLTVMDSEGLDSAKSKPVTIVAPVANFTYSPIDPYRGQIITFNASASTPSRGTIIDYAWDFESDGVIDAYGAVVTHNYTVYGNYSVTLNITDSEGLWDIATDTVRVYPRPPVANFTYSPYLPKANVTITFNASASYDPDTKTVDDPDGAIVSYRWDFGDNTTGTGNIVPHKYAEIGVYNVTLTVTDNDGLNGTMVKTLFVEIPPPSAQFTYSPMSPVEYEEITFDSSKSSSYKGTQIVKYRWDFGDGTIKTYIKNINLTLTPTHNYSTAGSYIVNLTVTDNSDPPFSGSIAKLVAVQRGLIEVEADVGTIHFVGERAEFYFLVKFLGKPVDATEPINAKLYYNGAIIPNFPKKVEHMDTGLYRILWNPIPDTASPGTYTVLIQASYFTLIDSTIKSFLISKTLTDWNPLLINVNGTVGTIKTDVGLIEVKLDDVDASLVSVEGRIATINSTIGLIQTDTATINAEIIAITGKIATIQTDVGVIKADLDAVEARVTGVDGNIAAIQTTLGTINGTITSIQDDIATIETDIGTIKTTLEGWSGGATSPITTPLGDFRILVLTTSTLEGPIAFSDNVLAITLIGPSGTTGTTNVVIPKQLLDGIESSIEKVAVTIDDEQIIFTYTEKPETYLLQIAYTHSEHTMKVYLTGLLLTPFPWAVLIAILVVAIVAAVGVAVYILKIRKPRVASASKNTATPDPTTLQP